MTTTVTRLTMLLSFLLLPINSNCLAIQTDFQIDTGYRTDQLDWNIAGSVDGTSPNVLSELIWDDLQIYQTQLHGSFDFNEDHSGWFHPQISGIFSYGVIVDGKNHDTDYRGDNRTLKSSQTVSASDHGRVYDISLAVGLKIPLLKKRLTLIPEAGYSVHRQDLEITHGYRVFPRQESIEGLDSHYDARWQGPWVGLVSLWELSKNLTFYGSSEYHDIQYQAVADWNLRSDFAHPVSFDHHANGSGWVHEAGLSFEFHENRSLTLSIAHSQWKARKGRDRLYLDNGTSLDTRLNQVNWESTSIHAGMTFRF